MAEDSAERGVVARLDVVTWKLHESPEPLGGAEGPAAESSAQVYRRILHALLGVLILACVVFIAGLFVGSSVVAITCVIAVVLACVAISFVARPYRRLRRVTGVPVIAQLKDLMASIALVAQIDRERIANVRNGDRSDPEIRTAQLAADKVEKIYQDTAKKIPAWCDMAASLDRLGWRRFRDIQVKNIKKGLRPVTERINAELELFGQQAEEAHDDDAESR